MTKNKQRTTMNRTNGNNYDLLSVSVDGSHEYQVNNKTVRSLLQPNNPTIYLTATSNSNHK